jgi:predicted HD phosphohydrolase
MKTIPSFDILINRLPKEVVQNLEGTEQSPKWHAEGNCLIHTRMVYDEAVKTGNIDLCLAAIFHDLGKIDTHVVKIDQYGKKKISHHKHEYASLKYIDEYFHLYKDFSTNKEKIIEIVKNHMRAHLYTSHQMKRPFKRQQFEKNPYFDEIIEFSGCDERGRIPG